MSHRYSLNRRLGGPQSPPGRYREVKILDPTGIRTSDPSVVRAVASRYTDYKIEDVKDKRVYELQGKRSKEKCELMKRE
jgi:hypothetical protein